MGSSLSGRTSAPVPALDFTGSFAYLAAHHTRRRSATRGRHLPRVSVPGPDPACWKRGFGLRRRTGRRSSIYGASRLLHASALGSWRPLRPPDPPLEPEDGALHLRLAGQHPHHRPLADHAAAAPGAGQGARSGGRGRPGAVRRHQAPGFRAGGHGRQALRAVLRQPPLARRHADQLADHLASIARLRELEAVLESPESSRPHRRRSCCS